jgi:hypothetical protein
MPLRRRGSSPAARWGRSRSTNGAGVRLGSPLDDWWRWRGRRWLQRVAVTRSRRRARGHPDSGEAQGGGGQCAAIEASPGAREEVGMVGRRRELAEGDARLRQWQWRAADGRLTRGSCDGGAFIAEVRAGSEDASLLSIPVHLRGVWRPSACMRGGCTNGAAGACVRASWRSAPPRGRVLERAHEADVSRAHARTSRPAVARRRRGGDA